jgi:hypothetical protein
MTKYFQLSALVVVLAIVTLTLPSTPAQAGDGREKYIEWYSDATKTEVVGWRQEYCGGTADSWGYQTSYRETWWGNECVDSSGGWAGLVCSYGLPGCPYCCSAYCSYCI